MNFLAHLMLSEEKPLAWIGNLLPDFGAATDLRHYHPDIRRGIILHRRIDRFADSHPLFRQSTARIGPDYRLLKGVMVDMFYDHFLALHWEDYSEYALDNFARRVYHSLQQHHDLLTTGLQRAAQYMISEDWLVSYRELSGIDTALQRMSSRLSRPNNLARGIGVLEVHYDDFRGDFQRFFPELQVFVKRQP